MGFIKLSCPNCGANIQLDKSREYGFCSYCGAKIVQDKIVVEHRIKKDSSPLLKRAQLFLEDVEYEEALKYCEKALDIDPENAEAYILMLMAETGVIVREDLARVRTPLNTYDSYKKAIRFASPEVHEELSRYNKQTIENDKEEQKKNELYEIEKKKEQEEIHAMADHLGNLKKKADISSSWNDRDRSLIIRAVIIALNIIILCLYKFSWSLLFTLIIECVILQVVILVGIDIWDKHNKSKVKKYEKTFDEKIRKSKYWWH